MSLKGIELQEHASGAVYEAYVEGFRDGYNKGIVEVLITIDEYNEEVKNGESGPRGVHDGRSDGTSPS